MMRKLLFHLLLLMVCSGIQSSWAINEDFLRKKVEYHLMAYEFDLADDYIRQLSHKGDRQFYQVHIPLYKFLGTLDPVYSDTFRTQWSETLAAVKELSEYKQQLFLAELHGKRAVIEFLEQNYLNAIRHAKNCYGFIQKYQKRYPESVESLKFMGLFNILLGNVPRRYQWLAKLLGYPGDLTLGVEQLEEAAAKSTLLQIEAQLVLCQVEKSMLDKPLDALDRLYAAKQKFNGNILIDYQLASGLMRLKRNDEAMVILSKVDQYKNDRVFYIPFWDFLLGKSYYYRNDYGNAQRHLALFVRDYKGKLMRTDAYFRLGMSLTLNNRYQMGQTFFQLIAAEQHGGFDEDEYAEYMAKKFATTPPDPISLSLFRARNYFDGGYYRKAKAVLSQLGLLLPPQSPFRTEMYYRQARIFHSEGALSQAIEAYEKCIQHTGIEENKWLQAYASYFLGEIAHEQARKEDAEVYYKAALKYDEFFYQAGLENRTKAALADLKSTSDE
ncbi:MAG: tetratricopeptide repeat protein [Bacteroidota bacterium]